jgi:hypothetical protein
VAYGLAGAIRAGDRIRAVARGAAEGARNASQNAGDAGASQDGAEAAPAEHRQPS